MSRPLRYEAVPGGFLRFDDAGFALSDGDRPNASKLFEDWYAWQALKGFRRVCDARSEQMGVRYESLKLTGASTRWGSCTREGTVRINWRLVMAPPAIADYVIVHELAHLVRLDHSPEFWRVVERAAPDWRASRRWLRENDSTLSWNIEREDG